MGSISKKRESDNHLHVDFHARSSDTGGFVDINAFGFLTTNPRGKGNWTSEDIPFHLILGVEPGQWEIWVTVGAIFTSDKVTLNLKWKET